jgi:hypothetical protein
MPFLCTTGAASSKGFGEFYQRTAISTTGWMARIGAWTGLMASDSSGNVYPLNNSGIVFKVDLDGNLLWQKNIRQPGSPSSTPVITNQSIQWLSTGYVVIGGYPSGGVISDGSFITFLDVDGNFSSAKSIGGGTGAGAGANLIASSAGVLYAAVSDLPSKGTGILKIYNNSVVSKKNYSNKTYSLLFIGSGASDTAYLGSNTAGPAATSAIAKVDSNLSFLWKLSNSSLTFLKSVESNGFVYAISFYSGSYALVAKFDASNGSFVWAKYLPGVPLSVAVDSSDNVYVSGYYTGTKAGIVFKLNSNGLLVWQRNLSISGLPSYDSTQVPFVSINNANGTICMQVSPAYFSTLYSILLTVPIDGSLTGTYTAGGTTVVYGINSDTLASASLTFGLSTVALGTSSVPDAAITLSSTSTTYTYNKVSVP